jgi:hypothetical protein
MRNAKIKLHNKTKIDFLGYRKYSTKAITPIKSDTTLNKFSTMDIETMNIGG